MKNIKKEKKLMTSLPCYYMGKASKIIIFFYVNEIAGTASEYNKPLLNPLLALPKKLTTEFVEYFWRNRTEQPDRQTQVEMRASVKSIQRRQMITR